jgi:hypothetical protein
VTDPESPPQRQLQVVATAGSEAEADLLLSVLAQAGIHAISQRAIGGPEFGASGARYVYVAASDVTHAREALGLAGETPIKSQEERP